MVGIRALNSRSAFAVGGHDTESIATLKEVAEKCDLRVVGREFLPKKDNTVLFVDGCRFIAVAAAVVALAGKKRRIVPEKTDWSPSPWGEAVFSLGEKIPVCTDAATAFVGGRTLRKAVRFAMEAETELVPSVLAFQPTFGENEFVSLLVIPPVRAENGESEERFFTRVNALVKKRLDEFKDGEI